MEVRIKMSAVETSEQYDYDGTYKLGEQPVHPVVLDALKGVDSQLHPGDIILDLGSGPGRLSHEAPTVNAYFIAIDGDPEAVRQYNESASSRGSSDRAHHGDIRQLEQTLSQTGVDRRRLRGAVFHRVLHVLDPQEQVDVLKQTRRALRPNSTIIVTSAADDDHKAQALRARGLYSPDAVNNCAPVMSGLPEETTFFGVHFADEKHLKNLAKSSHLRLRNQSVRRIRERSGYSDATNSYIFAEFQTPGRLFYAKEKLLDSTVRRVRRRP